MAQVRNYHTHRGVIIREVFKLGRWGFDTPFGLTLWGTLDEAKEAVDAGIERIMREDPDRAKRIMGGELVKLEEEVA